MLLPFVCVLIQFAPFCRRAVGLGKDPPRPYEHFEILRLPFSLPQPSPVRNVGILADD